MSWVQKGTPIVGSSTNILSGFTVSTNYDGTVIAIGSPLTLASSGASASAITDVYAWNGTSWVQRGSSISTSNYSGYSVALNYAGDIIVIGAPGPINNNGSCNVYQWDGVTWNKLGSPPTVGGAGDRTGWAVSINHAGDIIAYSNNPSSGIGRVAVCYWDGATWSKLGGSSISGTLLNFGKSVALDSTGNFVVIGSTSESRAYIYEYDVFAGWVAKGGFIAGTASSQFGYSVNMTSDGLTVIVGAPYYDVGSNTNEGYVAVYDFDGVSWIQKGSNVVGDTTQIYSGSAVSINSDGKIIGVGGSGIPTGTTGNGQIKVYYWDGSSWLPKGTNLPLTGTSNERAGYSLDMSKNGKFIIYGCPYHDVGTNTNEGRTYMYSFRSGPCFSYLTLKKIINSLPPNKVILVTKSKRFDKKMFRFFLDKWGSLEITHDHLFVYYNQTYELEELVKIHPDLKYNAKEIEEKDNDNEYIYNIYGHHNFKHFDNQFKLLNNLVMLGGVMEFTKEINLEQFEKELTNLSKQCEQDLELKSKYSLDNVLCSNINSFEPVIIIT